AWRKGPSGACGAGRGWKASTAARWRGSPTRQPATRHFCRGDRSRDLTAVVPNRRSRYSNVCGYGSVRGDGGGPLSRTRTITYIIADMTAPKDDYLIQ